MSGRRWWLIGPPIAFVLTLAGTGCQPNPVTATTAKPEAPAKVSAPAKEADLATIKLTENAEKHLGLTIATVEQKPVPRTASYGGDVIIPTGRLITVASPFIGTLRNAPGAAFPTPGTLVKVGQPIFVLIPILSPEARATMAPLLTEADGQVNQARESLNARKIELDRQDKLVQQKAGSPAALEDAKAAHSLAVAALRAVESRRDILAKLMGDVEGGKINVQTIEAPASGMIQNVHALPGQVVAAAALLFDVASLDPVWIKVPVYVGDLKRLDPEKDAGVGDVGEMGASSGAALKPAKPVQAPLAGDPLAATVHVFYQVKNSDHALRPGQRVNIVLPLRGDETSLTVPHASVVWDYHGGTWVYENTAPHTYVRRRVVVDRVVGNTEVLSRGPKPGAKVVADGAMELFGAELGGAK